jgi:hypothetical protein
MTTQVALTRPAAALAAPYVTLLLQDEIHTTIMEYQRGIVICFFAPGCRDYRDAVSRHIFEASRPLGLQKSCCRADLRQVNGTAVRSK